MNLTSRSVIKSLLKKYRLRPSKRLGQNFLIDKSVLKKIIEAADLEAKDIVLEIGPGLGTLTVELAKKANKVAAVEKDLKMIEILKETLKDFKNVNVINADILKLNTKYKVQDTRYKVVANLPYYITSPIIRKFLESKNPPKSMILMVQKEVARRICAKPPDMNLLAVSVQFYVRPVKSSQSKFNGEGLKIISHISKKSFWPSPKVDGAIIKIVPRQFRVPASSRFREQFFRIVKAGFSQPRKQLINNLSKGLKIDKKKVEVWLLKNKVQPTQRAETLNIKDWIKLTRGFSSISPM